MEVSIHLLTLSCGKEVLLKSNSSPEKITIEIQSRNDPSRYTGNIKISDLENKAKDLEKSINQLENDVRQALTTPRLDNGFVYEMDGNTFFLKKDLGAFKLNILEVQLEEKLGDIFDNFRILIEKNQQLKVELAIKAIESEKSKIIEREMPKLIEKLKEDREKHEVETKQKFLTLLNSKKRKISELLKKDETRRPHQQILSSDEEQISEKSRAERDCDTDDEILAQSKKPRQEIAPSSEEFFTRLISPAKSTNVPKALESAKFAPAKITPLKTNKIFTVDNQVAGPSKQTNFLRDLIDFPKIQENAEMRTVVLNLNNTDVDLNNTDVENDQMVTSKPALPKPLLSDLELLFEEDSEVPCSPLPESQSIFMSTFTRTPTSNPKSPYKYTKKVKRTPETVKRKKLNMEKAQSSPVLSQHGPFSVNTEVMALDDFLNESLGSS